MCRRLQALSRNNCANRSSGQLPVAPLGAVLSGYDPQHPTTQLNGPNAFAGADDEPLPRPLEDAQVKQQFLNSCFQLVDVLPARPQRSA